LAGKFVVYGPLFPKFSILVGLSSSNFLLTTVHEYAIGKQNGTEEGSLHFRKNYGEEKGDA